MKKATTVEEQITTLKERGLIINCKHEEALFHLSDIGYYRLGFYLFPFEIDYPSLKDRTHLFSNNSLFSDVLSLYHFDSDLRNILLYYINRIEINFRTKIVYVCSNYYNNDPTWFANPEYVSEEFITDFTEEYNKKLKIKFSVLKKHHKNYPDDTFAPAWKTIEFFSFGKSLNLYFSLLNTDLKREISKAYGVNTTTVFDNYMTLIVSLRNICAHGNMLYDYKLPKSIKSGPAIITTPLNNSKLYSAIIVIKYILSTISAECANNLDEEINDLFKEYSDVDKIRTIVKDVIK